MRAPARLGLYAAGLAALFAVVYLLSGAVVPASTVEAWQDQAAPEEHAEEDEGGHGADPVRGLAIEQDGYLLGEVAAPAETGARGTLAFQVTGPDGAVLTDYAVSHEQELHLIVVRTDGTGFRHVHPDRGADGTWSLPWTWDEPGTYRVYTDFVPADEEIDVTLTRTVEVAGAFTPRPAPEVALTDTVDGYDVALTGDLHAGAASELTATITRDGEPVTALEPYLGAWGHLVALREGDLAYLHVHPEGAEPAPGETSGPAITFATEAPTAGRYLLYLDFQIGGEVRTAAFTVETTTAPADTESDGGH